MVCFCFGDQIRNRLRFHSSLLWCQLFLLAAILFVHCQLPHWSLIWKLVRFGYRFGYRLGHISWMWDCISVCLATIPTEHVQTSETTVRRRNHHPEFTRLYDLCGFVSPVA